MAPLDDGSLSTQVTERLTIGTVVGEPRVFTDEFGFDTVGVEVALHRDAPVTVDLGTLAELLDTAFEQVRASGVGPALLQEPASQPWGARSRVPRLLGQSRSHRAGLTVVRPEGRTYRRVDDAPAGVQP